MDCLCRPSRIMSVRINLLDETNFIHEIKDDLPGQALLDVVFARLNLIEISYFGIRYIDDENQTHWLDPASRISRQMKPKPDPYDLYFGVKFYAADPCKLLEEITRYQLFLQVKQDVIQGRLPVAFELAAELGAFVVQSELGDYDTRRHSKGYVSEFRLLPNQSSELETRVAELHQQLKGMSPATAELSYLDKVKWHDMYGVDLHPVLGEDSVEYFLGLTPSGIVVLRNKATVAHYYWPRIAKVYYKGRYFMLRISDKNNELSTYGFETPRKAACKHLWRCCVEHHAFFRLVRVAPLTNSQSNNSDFFQVGSRLRYSGRSEKQVSKDALSIGRTPPAFTRVPSKRQPRRVIDDFLNSGSHKNSDCFNGTTTTTMLPNGIPISSVAYESPYRSTYSIPTSLSIRPFHHNQPQLQDNYNDTGGGGGVISAGGTSNLQTPDSPRSTRSAPWPRSTQQRSLFGHNPSSPRSVRSVSVSGNANGHQHHHHHHHNQSHSNNHHHHHHHHQPQRQHSQRDQAHQQRHRSNSMESHSSNDSRSTRRHKHRHRRTSDNESELSRGSGRSGRSHHRKHRRSRHRRDSAGSGDHDSMRGRSYSGHRSSSARSGSAELIDSASQWREAQRRQAEAGLGQSSIQQASVSKSSMVTRSLNSNDSHSDTHSHHKSRRHRKNKSPSDSRTRIWSSELAKHLQFDLVDTAGMTEDQLREIPYTVVETNSKRSTSNLKIHKSNSKNSVGGKSTGSGTASHGNASNSGAQAKNRVDRIRGLYLQGSQPQELTGIKNGSIRSASTISSRECERNNGLVRMMSSMSMGDFITPIGTNLSPLENSALRVSHEHTDSGLGADQDYAYSSERSSDSTRYGTNKSSGASSGSHRKSAGQSAGSGYNNLLQQTVSNQQQQHQQQYLQQKQQNQKPRETSLHYAQTQHQQHSHKNNYKYNTQSSTNQNQSNTLAPIHNLHNANKNTHKTTSSNHSTNSIHIQNNNNNNHNNPNANGNGKNVSEPSPNNKEAGNRLLNYTTFENNQYKFSLNNIFGKRNINMGAVVGNRSTNNINTNIQKDLDSFVEWPNTPAAPYYYEMPCTSRNQVAYKKRDAKSDIGVPIGHLASKKMQYLGPLGMPNTACYPLLRQTHLLENNSNQATPLQPARSELFLSYMPTTTFNGEHERPYIYNYKMPEMPEFVSSNGKTNSQQQLYYQKQQQQQQKDNNCDSSAYYISGAQTADLAGPLPPTALYNKSTTNNCSGSIGNSVVGANSNSHGGSNSLLYGGAKPATDVMYYQFDNGKLPIVQQPKSLLNKTTNCDSVGPLVFVHHGGQKQKQKQKSTQNTVATATNQKTCTNNNNKMNSKPITNISNMHKHPKRSQLDIDEEDETEVNEESTTSQHNNAETQNNKYYECDEEPNQEDENENVKATENVLSFMSNSHSSNNTRTEDEQLLSPTNKTITNANNNENTANSVSNLANFNLDNCNANTNPVQQSNTTGTNITNDKTKTSLIPNIDGTYNCNRNQNDTMTNRIDNIAYEVNYNHNQNQNQNQNYNQPIDNENENQLNSNSNLLQNRNLSSSLEIILSPIIQSSRRAQ